MAKGAIGIRRTLPRHGPNGAELKHHFRAGNESFDQGQFEEAVREYEAALEKSPEQPAVLLNLATALLKLGRLEDALVTID